MSKLSSIIPRKISILQKCPKCGGQLYRSEDGPECLQCGHITYNQQRYANYRYKAVGR